ncbi:MAG: diaminopimelate decarboxylase [Planctomycetes bacterium]|nr:diaminopimelate decarboxylase [Planctomycetota bacterium]
MTLVPGDLLAQFGSPLYVYDEAELRHRCRAIRDAVPLSDVDVLYAMKANANPALLQIVREEGLGIDAVSLGEVRRALRCGFSADRISFNGNNVGDSEMSAVRKAGVHVTVDSLSQLARFGRLAPGARVAIRINPDIGDGHHDHVITGGPASKFGIEHRRVGEALDVATRAGLVIDGVQHHIGSGVLDAEVFLKAMDVLLSVAARVPDHRFVDFGGGFGVPYAPGDATLDLMGFGARAAELMIAHREATGRDVGFRFEPGRLVVATCGTLYVTVTAVKRHQQQVWVGTDSGFNHLLRPALYGSYHAIENVTSPDGPLETVNVAGNVCEAGDVFARERSLPRCRDGDVLAIRDTGAYGWSMASTYNLRARPAEVLIGEGGPQLIRPREDEEDL